jgi:hypothetical protein
MALLEPVRDFIMYHVSIGQEMQCARMFQGEGRVRASWIEAVLHPSKCLTFEQTPPHPLLQDDLCESLHIAMGHEDKINKPATDSTTDSTTNSTSSISGWIDQPLQAWFDNSTLLGGLTLTLDDLSVGASSAPVLLLVDKAGRLGLHVMGVDPRSLAQSLLDGQGSAGYEEAFAFEVQEERQQLWKAMQKLSETSLEHACSRQADTKALQLLEAHATISRLRHHRGDAELRAIWAAYNVAASYGCSMVESSSRSNQPHLELLNRRMQDSAGAPLQGWLESAERAAYVVFHGLGHPIMHQTSQSIYAENEMGRACYGGIKNEGIVGHIRTNQLFCLSTVTHHAIYDTLMVLPFDLCTFGHPFLPLPETYANSELVSVTEAQELRTRCDEAAHQPMLLSAIHTSETMKMVSKIFSLSVQRSKAFLVQEFDEHVNSFHLQLQRSDWKLVEQPTHTSVLAIGEPAAASVAASVTPLTALSTTPSARPSAGPFNAPPPLQLPEAVPEPLERQWSRDSFDELVDEDLYGSLAEPTKPLVDEARRAMQEASALLDKTNPSKNTASGVATGKRKAPAIDEIAPTSKLLKNVSQTSMSPFGAMTPTTMTGRAAETVVDSTEIKGLLYAALLYSASRRRAWERARKTLAQQIIMSSFKTHTEATLLKGLHESNKTVNSRWLDCQKGILDAIYVHFGTTFNHTHGYADGYHTVSSCLAKLRQEERRGGTRMAAPWSAEVHKDTAAARHAMAMRLDNL